MKQNTYRYSVILFIVFSVSLLSAGSTQLDGSWTPVGPEGGWIGSLVQHPAESNTIYAVPKYNNPSFIYKSTDSGDNWFHWSTINTYIYQLAIFQGDPMIMYAGSYGFVYKSTNGGLDWVQKPYTSHFDVNDMEIHPSNPEVIYACGNPWIVDHSIFTCYQSTNSGASWEIQYFDSTKSGCAYCISLDPVNPQIIYIGGYIQNSYSKGFIFKSTNGGTDWTDITPASTSNVYSFEDILVDPGNTNRIWAVNSSYIYRSTNGGTDWQKNNGWADGNVLALDPSNSNILYSGYSNACFKSTDSGINWTYYTSGLFGGSGEAILVNPSESNRILLSNVSGIFKSTDGGVHWSPSNTGIFASRIAAIRLAPSSPNILFAALSNNAVYKTTNAQGKSAFALTSSWERTAEYGYCGSTCDLMIDPTDPDLVFSLVTYN